MAAAPRLRGHEVSFLAVDVANPHAFGAGQDPYAGSRAAGRRTCRVFEELLHALERSCAEEFRRGFIAQSPQKLRRIHQYFAAVRGLAAYPPVRCNAPEFSAVIIGAG